MLNQVRILLTLGLCSVALAAGVSPMLSRSYGQGKGPTLDDAKIMLPRGGQEKLTNDFNSAKHREAWKVLVTAERTYSPERDKDVIDTSAQWFVYRLTWPW